jgi:hypothetical protein
MFSEFKLAYILLSSFALIAIASFFVNRYLKSKNITGKARVIATIKFNIYIYIFLCFVLWFSLPSTPSLSSFGYPYGIEDIATNDKLLRLLQDYNHAIVRTTEVLHFFIFFTAIWLASNFFSYTRSLKNQENE